MSEPIHIISLGAGVQSSCMALDEVDFSTEEDRGQINMFNNDCTGMCGV